MGLIYFHDEFPIEGFVGSNGSGKTALAVTDAIRRADRHNKALYSNIYIKHKRWKPLESIGQFQDLENCHILLDEINAIFPARNTLGIPQEMQLLISSLRHRDSTLAWTTPSPAHADVSFRRVTQTITASKPVLQVFGQSKAWPRTIWSFFTQYDMRQMVNEDEGLEMYPVHRRGLKKLSDFKLNRYDTHAPVKVLNDHLVCQECGGAKKKQYCSGNHPLKVLEHSQAVQNPFGVAS